jgi:hypothetical protein
MSGGGVRMTRRGEREGEARHWQVGCPGCGAQWQREREEERG